MRSFLVLFLVALLLACSTPGAAPPRERVAPQTAALVLDPPAPPAPQQPPTHVPVDTPLDPLPADPAGYLDGHSSVTPTGEFTYTLPIAVPPGRAGMQPSLALTYGSRGGNDLAGVGWSLAGLSEIRRCGRTLATEGEVDGVDFDATDRFCLDGQKLIAVSGFYGGDGTEYRTERDPFARIVSHGNAGPPSTFEVFAKDGRILRYKALQAFRVQPSAAPPHDLGIQDEVTYRWLLEEIRDRSGNTIEYQYNIDAHPGQYAFEAYVERIEYTGRTGVDPGLRAVVFHYEPRPDPLLLYESGVPTYATRRLRAIELHAPDPDVPRLVGAYELDYGDLSSVTGRSLLRGVTRCDAYDACLWGRSFSYEAAARPDFDVFTIDGVEFPELYFSLFDGDPQLHVFDADGDGRDDLLYDAGGELYLRRGEPDGPLGPRVQVNAAGSAFTNVVLSQSRPVDVDGDGIVEILAARNPPGEYRLYRWNPGQSRFDAVGSGIPVTSMSPGTLAAAQLLDTDGDGRLDLFLQEHVNGHLQWSILENTGQGFGPSQPTGVAAPCGASARGADVDGDGRGELLVATPGCSHTALLGVNDFGGLFLDPAFDLGYSAEQAIQADLNGDGLRDALFLDDGIGAHVRWNTGNGFGPLTLLVNGPYRNGGLDPGADGGTRVADVNGDGREDIIAFRNIPGPRILVYLSRGDGTFAPPVDIGQSPGTLHAIAGWSTSQIGDFNGDGRLDLVVVDDRHLRVLRQRPGNVDILTGIQDEGHVRPREQVFYSPDWSDGSPAPPSCTYPQRCLRHGLLVVREHRVDQGAAVGGYRRALYEYDDPRVDLRGRGFLGFGRQRIRDPDRPAETTITFDHQTEVDGIYPYAGLPATVTHAVPILEQQFSGPSPPPIQPRARVTFTEHQYQLRRLHQDRTYFVPESRWTADEWEENVLIEPDRLVLLQSPNVPALRRRRGSVSHDDFGNLLTLIEETVGGVRREVRTFYQNDTAAWLLGLPQRSEAQAWDPNDAVPAPRVVEYEHDPLGRLFRVLVEPQSADLDLRRITSFYRNGDGQITNITDEAPGEPVRRAHVEYDPLEGAFPVQVWNDLGHAAWIAHHHALGLPGRITDLNGVQAERRVDGFGRVVRVEEDGGAQAEVTFGPYSPGGAREGLRRQILSSDGTSSRAIFDLHGRLLEESAHGFEGQWVHRSVRRDLLGRVVEQRRPGYGAPGAGTLIRYDTLDRPLEVLAPDGARSRYQYSFSETRRWDPRDNEHRIIRDIDDRIIESADELDGQLLTTVYGYGPFDLITEIEDPQHNLTLIAYDALGRREVLADPDRGANTTLYNGFGEVRQETDALQQSVIYHRDTLGRLFERIDADGITQYTWDQGPNAVGRLSMTVSPDGTQTEHCYDALGRPDRTVWTIGGQTHEVGTGYDALGRLETIHYPEIPGQPRFMVKHGYNLWGDLDEIEGGTAAGVEVRWTAEARSPEGALEEAELGNGVRTVRAFDALTGRPEGVQALAPGGGSALYSLEYKYDANGNVEHRNDAVTGRQESFGHDALDRLSTWTLAAGGGQRDTRYEYDVLGNLTDVLQDGVLVTHNVYGANGKPHALTDVLPQGTSYQYDAIGRLSGGGGRVLSYTAFDLPRTITQGSSVTSFLYDAFGARVRKSGPGGEIVYVGDLYERRERGGQVGHVFFVRADGAPIAQVVANEATGERSTRYLHSDTLGSIGLVTNEAGGEAERVYFEPFGQRIEEDGTAVPGPTGSAVELGFTGHRHDDELGLIDMRGRVYDPALRRFLTPDPVVADPLFGQSYNRYAYALNNPLRYVDPSGYQPVSWWPDTAGCGMPPPTGGIGVTVRFDVTGIGRRPPAGGGKPGNGGARPTTGSSDGAGFQPSTGAVAKPSATPGATPKPEAEPAATGAQPGGGGDDDGGEDDGTAVADEGGGSWKDHPAAQGIGGFVAGLGIGVVPGAGPTTDDLIKKGVLSEGTREARIGKALGEIVGGVALTVLGLGGKIGGIGISLTGVGALVGVPAAVVSATLAVAGAANVATGIEGLSQALSTGGSAGSPKVAGKEWKAHPVGSDAAKSGCVEAAAEIQKQIGGKISVIKPRFGRLLGGVREIDGGPFKNPAENLREGWFNHNVVVKDGKVYDMLTGPAGQSISAYKARWEFADVIDFGF